MTLELQVSMGIGRNLPLSNLSFWSLYNKKPGTSPSVYKTKFMNKQYFSFTAKRNGKFLVKTDKGFLQDFFIVNRQKNSKTFPLSILYKCVYTIYVGIEVTIVNFRHQFYLSEALLFGKKISKEIFCDGLAFRMISFVVYRDIRFFNNRLSKRYKIFGAHIFIKRLVAYKFYNWI